MSWLRIDEGRKQKKLKFKSNSMKKGQPQKHKANNKSVGGDCNTKFRKVIETNEGLKSVMSTMTNEEQTNLALISALSAPSIQPSVSGNNTLVSALSACNIQPS